MITEVRPLLLAFRGLSDEDGDETEIPDAPDADELDGDDDEDDVDDGFGNDAGDDKDLGGESEF